MRAAASKSLDCGKPNPSGSFHAPCTSHASSSCATYTSIRLTRISFALKRSRSHAVMAAQAAPPSAAANRIAGTIARVLSARGQQRDAAAGDGAGDQAGPRRRCSRRSRGSTPRARPRTGSAAWPSGRVRTSRAVSTAGPTGTPASPAADPVPSMRTAARRQQASARSRAAATATSSRATAARAAPARTAAARGTHDSRSIRARLPATDPPSSDRAPAR